MLYKPYSHAIFLQTKEINFKFKKINLDTECSTDIARIVSMQGHDQSMFDIVSQNIAMEVTHPFWGRPFILRGHKQNGLSDHWGENYSHK